MYRRYRSPTFWQEMNRLQRQMDRLFDQYQPGRFRPAPSYPALNIWTAEDDAVVTAEIPGVDPDDIQITVVGETMTLAGERTFEEHEGDVRYHRRERGSGKFTRSITLPFLVDADRVEARFDKGLLYITLPRAEADKPRRIAVKAA